VGSTPFASRESKIDLLQIARRNSTLAHVSLTVGYTRQQFAWAQIWLVLSSPQEDEHLDEKTSSI
jgi:hypothetical protein